MKTVVMEREGTLEAVDVDGAYYTAEIRMLPTGRRETGDKTLSLRLSWPVAEGDPVPENMILGHCKLRLEIERGGT